MLIEIKSKTTFKWQRKLIISCLSLGVKNQFPIKLTGGVLTIR